ncbi:MAG: type VI secretion system ATPase TssH, partial [Eubacterium sp.]|nr:type VI secretion system ATPase TssH [Eubacterium sp.]
PLGKDDIRRIIDLLVASVNDRIKDREITLRVTDAAAVYITDQAYDPSYGARPLRRYIQKHIETLIAKELLADNIHPGDTVTVDAGADGLVVG